MDAPLPAAPDGPDGQDGVVTSLEDPLMEIDRIMQRRRDDLRQIANRNTQISLARAKFATAFATECEQHVRPAMEAVLERLRRNGGGGFIEERPEDLRLHHTHRVTLWMSLSGEIEGTPRQDRDPYLELDANIDKRMVTVTEGDMWQGEHASTGVTTRKCRLSDITTAFITHEAVAILRRSIE